MSSDWIVLIPCQPHYVPDVVRQLRARARFAELAPDADEIAIRVYERIRFFDCGANFERVLCPSCSAELPFSWWQLRMDEDYKNDGFELARYGMPCCSATHPLNELVYQEPQGFARFAIAAINLNVSDLSDRDQAEFERILGTRLLVIYQHI